jgi:hypothetical protein
MFNFTSKNHFVECRIIYVTSYAQYSSLQI